MKLYQGILSALLAGLLLTGLSACEKQEGPAEQAGKAIDEAASNAAEQAQDAKEAVQEQMKQE